MQMRIFHCVAALILLCSCRSMNRHDLIITNGLIYDGSGAPPQTGAIAIDGDRITAISLGDSNPKEWRARETRDAGGLAVAPGFINMLSWATESLLHDPRSQGDIRQGVTLEVMGEGVSMGPWNDAMIADEKNGQGDIKFEVKWRTLGEYLQHLEERGVSCNVASFVGATTLRVNVLGYEDRDPSAEELDRMCALARGAMEEGALGVASALIYTPAFYANTEELIALAKVAAEYDGMYITHMRSEGNQLLEALEETLRIARESGAATEVYHLKAAGQSNWHKMDEVIRRIEAARAEGLRISADMYTYTAAATGLDAAMPPWAQEGGYRDWVQRLREPETRERIRREMSTPSNEWENLLLAAGTPENVLLVGFKNDDLKPLTGKTLAEVSKMRGKSPEETAMDLVIEDGSRVSTVYFLMSEENIRKQIALPWVSFDSDAASQSPEGPFLKSNPHPRAYGNFARLLAKYVREEKVITVEEAVRKLAALPAENLKLKDRGRLREGCFADVVIFDPATIQDHATFDRPHQYSTGVRDVFVNGVLVLKDGEHTGATPGKFVRGPGWKAAD